MLEWIHVGRERYGTDNLFRGDTLWETSNCGEKESERKSAGKIKKERGKVKLDGCKEK